MSERAENINTAYLVPKLRFKEFVGKWNYLLLGDLFTFKNGLNSDKDKYGSGVKFINVLDIMNDRTITYESIIGSVEVSEKEFEKNEVGYGDVLFQRSSETREEVGQANVYLDKEKRAVFGGFVIRGKGKIDYDPFFMNYLLKTSSARKEITTKSGGSTRYNVGQESLGSVLVQTTIIPEQQKIASFLTAVDEKIQQLTRKKTLLDQYKKGVMQGIFCLNHDAHDIPDDHDEKKSSASSKSQKSRCRQLRFKDEDGKDYPDWEEIKVQQLIDRKAIIGLLDGNHGELYPKSEEFTEDGVPYVAANNLINGLVNFSDCKYLPIERASKFKKGISINGDVLFAHNATVGPTAMLKTELDYVILSTTVTYYRCNNEALVNTYLIQYFNSDNFIRQFTRVMSQSTRNQVPITMQKKFKIILPSLPEQQKIATYLSNLDQKIEIVNHQITHAQTFKKGLLQGMFV